MAFLIKAAQDGRIAALFDTSIYSDVPVEFDDVGDPTKWGANPAIPSTAVKLSDGDAARLAEGGDWRWLEGKLVLQVDIENAKFAKTSAVNAKRDAVIFGGYQHNFGGTVGIRTLDQRDARDETAWLVLERQASKAMAAVEAGLIEAADARISIRDAKNEQFTVSTATAVAAMDGMAAWRYSVSKHSWDLKDAIQAAEDQDEIDAIDIDEGWPE